MLCYTAGSEDAYVTTVGQFCGELLSKPSQRTQSGRPCAECSGFRYVLNLCKSIAVKNHNAVMPLDALGRTVRILLLPPPFFPLRHLTNSFLQRATLTEPASTSPWPKGLGNLVKLCRAGARALQLLLFNVECLVSASHQLALITSLPFGGTRG